MKTDNKNQDFDASGQTQRATLLLIRGLRAATIAALLAGSISPASATTQTWTGGTSTTWSTSGNWNSSAGPAPVAGDTALFNGLGNGNTSINVTSTAQVKSITFDTANAAAYTLSGSAFTLGNAGTIQTTSTVANVETINNNLMLGTGYTFSSNSSNSAKTLNFGGVITAGTSNTLTLTGTNTGSNTISGAIGGASSALVKMGTGTWILSGANTYTGSTTVDNGILTLDFSAGASQVVASTSALVVNSGGTINIKGKSGATSSQTFASTAIGIANPVNGPLGGADNINFVQNGATSLAGALGTISRNVGSTVNFTLPTTGTVTATSGGAASTTGILIASTGSTVFATVGNNDWAAINGGNLVGGSTIGGFYTASTTTTLGGNADVALGVTGTTVASTTLISLRVNQNQATTITVSTGGTLTIPGILVTSAVGANTTTINGAGTGRIRAGNVGELVLIQNNTSAPLTINAPVIADGTAGLTKSGAGTVNLTNLSNTYTGVTFLNAGILNIAGDTALGNAPATATSNQISMNGGTLQMGASSITLNSNRGIMLGNGGGTIDTQTYTATTYGGIIASAVNSTGGFTKAGASALTLTGASTFTTGTTVSAGTLYVNGGTAGSGTLSGIGTGAVTVNSGAKLAGSGNIVSTGVSISSGGSLASGPAQANAPNVTGPGLTFTNTSVSLASANLTFDLGAGNTSGAGYHTFGTPNTNTTYLTLSGTSTLNFSGSDTLSLVDLTSSNTLALRQGTPYLLVMASSDSAYTGLVTSADGKGDDLTMDGTGWVFGVGTTSSYTPISIAQYGADGITALTGANSYPNPVLYLDSGDLEVVPEPGTWALMLGGLTLLIVIQRRKQQRNL